MCVLLASGASGFAPATTTSRTTSRGSISSRIRPWSTPYVGLSNVSEDCGCGGATVSGNPSDKARSINPREAVAETSLFTIDGQTTKLNDILPQKGTSLVVFTRSLG